jgi:hypothetical protein
VGCGFPSGKAVLFSPVQSCSILFSPVQPSSALFSIPTNHFSKECQIEIPFSFKKRRDTVVAIPINGGGQPEMHLSYSLEDLPDRIQVALKK